MNRKIILISIAAVVVIAVSIGLAFAFMPKTESGGNTGALSGGTTRSASNSADKDTGGENDSGDISKEFVDIKSAAETYDIVLAYYPREFERKTGNNKGKFIGPTLSCVSGDKQMRFMAKKSVRIDELDNKRIPLYKFVTVNDDNETILDESQVIQIVTDAEGNTKVRLKDLKTIGLIK